MEARTDVSMTITASLSDWAEIFEDIEFFSLSHNVSAPTRELMKLIDGDE